MKVDLPIVGLGMISALGLDAIQSCAAQRAGISRARELTDFLVEDPDSMEVPVMAHQVSPLTDGFVQAGRWVRLASLCLRGLEAYAKLPGGDPLWRRTALLVAVPDASGPRFGWPGAEMATIVADAYVRPLMDLARLDALFRPQDVYYGHAGALAAACAAKQHIDSGACDRALVLGVDSYLESLSLSTLHDEDRLKSASAPVGLVPGEAAACFLLERRSAAERRGSSIEAHLAAARYASAPSEEHFKAWRSTLTGNQLGAIAADVLIEAGEQAPFVGDIIVDLNGEEWKARAWGTAQARLTRHIDFDRSNLILPCGSFGEIGAASGAAAVCVGVRSFVRGYARSRTALVLSMSEDGAVAAAVLTAR